MASKNVINSRDWRAQKQLLAEEIGTLSVAIAEHRWGEDETVEDKERHAAKLAEYRRIYAKMEKIEQSANEQAARRFWEKHGRELACINLTRIGEEQFKEQVNAVFVPMIERVRTARTTARATADATARALVQTAQNRAALEAEHARQLETQKKQMAEQSGAILAAAMKHAQTGATPAPGAAGNDGAGADAEKIKDETTKQQAGAGTAGGAIDREISQKEAARLAGATVRTIWNWEHGIKTPPGFPGLRSEARYRTWVNDYIGGKAGKQAANRALAKQQKAEAMSGGGR